MNETTEGSLTFAPSRPTRSLEAALTPRLAIERRFAANGHSDRHGRFYRHFEHHVTRPLLKLGLQMMGLYGRGIQNALSPVVRRVVVPIANLPIPLRGFQILHLSDFHIDENPRLAAVLVPFLRDLKPDLCVFTGDYRFEDFGPCEGAYPLMRQIVEAVEARYGIFGILGNHDESSMAYRLDEIGIRMLVNEAVPVGDGESPLWLIGVDDPFDYRCDDLPRALAGIPQDDVKVLLAHAPEIYEEAEAAGVDLYLSGHTHAGQIRVPMLGALRQNANCPREYTFGHWAHGKMQGYTSAGVGCSSVPVRFNCPPEIVLLELQAAR